MRKANVFMHHIHAGILTEYDDGHYTFNYLDNYNGPAVSLTMPTTKKKYDFLHFPAFFDGLLPEGHQLEALLRLSKLDRNDYLAQLITVGQDLVGAVTITAYE